MVWDISLDEILERQERGFPGRLVFVLDPRQYEQEHIPGSINIPVDELERTAKDVLDKNETVIVYCSSFTCQASTRAAEKLGAMGYTHVFDYAGGIEDYKENGLPLEGRLHEYPQKT